MNKCLYCYQNLEKGEIDFHSKCSMKIFGVAIAPLFQRRRHELNQLGEGIINSKIAITGTQVKLSLEIHKVQINQPKRLIPTEQLGTYILKSQTYIHKHLPEIEDLTMHLAEIAKIKVVPHSLIRFSDGELCYITKRIDRDKAGNKFPMEDMCQLSELLTQYKYNGSYEGIAKLIFKYSSTPKLDIINFWEIILFSWIVGNTDMHLKNFSIYSLEKGRSNLTPAYGMLSTTLAIPGDKEELALNLNDKKRDFKKEDFIIAMQNSDLEDKIIENIFNKFKKALLNWMEFIDRSFLPEDMIEKYKIHILNQAEKL